MLSPQPVKREVSFNDSPMEVRLLYISIYKLLKVEPLRKKSSAKDLQAPSRKSSAPRRHANIPTRKASQMATKRLDLLLLCFFRYSIFAILSYQHHKLFSAAAPCVSLLLPLNILFTLCCDVRTRTSHA